MTVTTKLPDCILQTWEASNEPMSLDEIQDKFDPGFPFKAKKVLNAHAGEVFTIKVKLSGHEIYTCGCCGTPSSTTEGTSYWDDVGFCKYFVHWAPDSKAWVYVG